TITEEGYAPLDAGAAVAFASGVLPDASSAEEIGDGNLNLIFRVAASGGASVIVKQALPYLRVVGEAWPLTLDRARIEHEALTLHHRLAPGLVTKVLGFDEARAAIVMEALRGYEVWRRGLNAQRRYPGAPADIGRFCGLTLLGTSNLLLDPAEWKSLLA